MAGMGDGYVGTAQDAVRIRRLEKQREVERRKIQELKNKSASVGGQTGLLQFGSGTSEILETAFKKETVGLVTREQYVEKRVNIRNKVEEEEKEKLQKLQQEEEELQLQKRKKRRIKGNPRLSFSDEIENGSDEDVDNNNQESKKFGHGKFGKDPTVETSFLPDSEREAEEQAERERLRRQWLREQEQIRNEPLEITYSYWDGAGHRRVIQVRKGDTIGEFLRAVQQQLAPEFREIRTTSVENLLYVKEDLIIPHQHSFYELIINKARGKSGPLFHFDVHEDVRTIADATIEKDEPHLLHGPLKAVHQVGPTTTEMICSKNRASQFSSCLYSLTF
ncbi:protein XAP5 CIRCADIAN TIMEKEEPER isoform X3 [Magnolia sinica]|uniref:protein XAP5 CIRCADIAN TIMEKEEPER isoform X3 n=1 Tax=Magnolia sinica TaxID=86752 RepID=UPI002659D585|nr:protein XAP5 CIRCADIAN TIMEKEEPER isoform X3 [Magnolia sinica]